MEIRAIGRKILKPNILYWGIVIVILCTFIFGNTGFIKLFKMWNESKRLETEIAQVQQRNEYLKKQVKSLSDPTDLKRLELEARKKGMAAQDEVVILVR